VEQQNPQALWTGLEPYSQLVGSLLPHSAGACVFDAAGELRWSPEDSTGCADLEPLVAESIARARHDSADSGELLQLPGGIPSYLFWLRDDAGGMLAVVGICWKQPEAAPRPFATVQSFVRPAMEALRRELLSRSSIAHLTHALDTRDRDLGMLLSASDEGPGGAEHDDEVAFLLKSAATHLRCSFAALIVPEKKLIVLRAPAGHKVDATALAKTHRQLNALAQLHREPVILNSLAALPGAESLPYRVLSAPVRHPSGRADGVLALFRAQSAPEFVDREARLAALLSRRCASIVEASYDPLSGLLNRAAFEQRCRVALADLRKDRPWTCLYLDTDRMHVINGNFGMHIGDRLITQIGELVRSRLLPNSHAARVYGDRFAILLPTGKGDATTFAEALRESISQITPVSLGATDSRSVPASVSIGIAPVTDPPASFAHDFAAAETACKAAKHRGRNRVELYLPSDLSMVRHDEDVNIAPSLQLAIAQNRLALDAQLIVPLAGSRVSIPHFELLLRIIDQSGETIGPDRFLAAAERSQVMPMVDRWVVDTALQMLKPHAALLAERPMVFTINLSGQSFGDPEFGDHVVERITRSGLNPRAFCFEITESAAITNLQEAGTLMGKLRALGCELALDDFGTGQASLAYLRQLPVDILKIDGSFVRDVLKNPRAASMIEAIAALARTMKLVTVAEQVETDEIRIRMGELGVDYGQGFSIARPAPFADLLVELPMYATARSITTAELEAPPFGAGIEVTIEPGDETIPATRFS
jgi:diguanylate cyclase (GGDEF)-like protein